MQRSSSSSRATAASGGTAAAAQAWPYQVYVRSRWCCCRRSATWGPAVVAVAVRTAAVSEEAGPLSAALCGRRARVQGWGRGMTRGTQRRSRRATRLGVRLRSCLAQWQWPPQLWSCTWTGRCCPLAWGQLLWRASAWGLVTVRQEGPVEARAEGQVVMVLAGGGQGQQQQPGDPRRRSS